MTSPTINPPAIILGVGITALGVMRSLSRAGIKTYCADSKIDFVSRSRFYSRPAGAELINEPGDLNGFLSRLKFDTAVLMPCGDQWSRAIYDIPAELTDRFPVCVPPAEVWNKLTDKGQLADFLVEQKIPHPRSVPIDDEQSLAAATDLFPGEWFIKPCDSERFFRNYWVKAIKIAGADELRAHATRLFKDNHQFILQEYIPGPASNHFFIDGFIDRHGNVAGLLARNRLRMYPPLFGNSSYMVTVSRADAAREIDLILSALKTISYRGIFSAEFKRDQRDNTPRLLEINTRPWWYIWFAERCGISMARMAYADALSREVVPQESYSIGTFMVYPPTDFEACRTAMKTGELSPTKWIGDWIKAKQAVFWIGDPLPSIWWFVREVWRSLKRRLSGKRVAPPGGDRGSLTGSGN